MLSFGSVMQYCMYMHVVRYRNRQELFFNIAAQSMIIKNRSASCCRIWIKNLIERCHFNQESNKNLYWRKSRTNQESNKNSVIKFSACGGGRFIYCTCRCSSHCSFTCSLSSHCLSPCSYICSYIVHIVVHTSAHTLFESLYNVDSHPSDSLESQFTYWFNLSTATCISLKSNEQSSKHISKPVNQSLSGSL